MTNTRIRFAAALAAISFTAASIPAIAHAADPEASASSAKQSGEKAKLSNREKRVKICRPETNAPSAKTICLTRAQWIREGLDPLAGN